MIGLVMTHCNREEQLFKTLDSFKQYNPNDFFVHVIDDTRNEDLEFPDYDFEVSYTYHFDKKWSNSCIPFNYGIGFCIDDGADIIILQNAECCHLGDILGYVKKNLNESNYISFGCYSQGKDETIGSVINAKGASFNGESAWYNHPVYRPVGYHFCSAITAKNMIKLNGFDERLKDGIAYDDDFYLHQVNNLGLKIVITSTPYVIHQWHEQTQWGGESNENLYNELVQSKDYKAVHLITPDL